MNLQQLGTQLKREAAANKGKAAVLGTITLTAVYFWLPLLADWFSSDDPVPVTPAIAVSASQTGTQQVTPATVKTADVKMPPWQDVVKWINDDPRMKPAELANTAHDVVRPGQSGE